MHRLQPQISWIHDFCSGENYWFWKLTTLAIECWYKKLSVSLVFLIWIFFFKIRGLLFFYGSCFSVILFSCLSSLIDIPVLFAAAFPPEILHQQHSLGHAYFFQLSLLPHSNIILPVFPRIDTVKWFFQYSSLPWTWCFTLSFTFIPPLSFPLTGTHSKYNPFQPLCRMSAPWVKGFLGNTKYGKLLYLPAHQLVTDSYFYAEIIYFRTALHC